MTDKLKLWDAVKRPPEDMLKGFTRGGGFRGTAIKPMWAVRTMTEQFGPCGEGWGTNEPQFTVQSVGNEILVYCTVSVWHTKRENVVYGVGGDKVLVSQSSGLRSDDEAFKKAFTDAMTNAMKHLGVGADIHMGLWDGSKYADQEPETPKAKLQTVAGTQATPKAQSREPFDKIQKGIKTIVETGTVDDLSAWYKSHAETIRAFSVDWHEEIMGQFTEAKETLKARAA